MDTTEIIGQDEISHPPLRSLLHSQEGREWKEERREREEKDQNVPDCSVSPLSQRDERVERSGTKEANRSGAHRAMGSKNTKEVYTK